MRIMCLTVFLVLTVFILPAQAEEADSCQKRLKSVYDNRDQKVIVTGTQFIEMSSVEPVTVMIVPSDKNFVLTQITATPVSSSNLGILLQENKKTKTIISFSSKQNVQDSLHFNSGITFAPGSSVVLKPKFNEGGGCVNFSGYLTETK